MRSSGATKAVRGRGSLDAGVTPGRNVMRDDEGNRQRELHRCRTS